MKSVTFLPGALVASGLIGAVVAVGGVVFTLLTQPDSGVTTLLAAPLIMFLAVPVGFMVSVAPNVAGAALLAWLGRGNVSMRLPVMWALVGAGAGGALAVTLDGNGLGAAPAGTMAAIGATSALLCRLKTRWTDILANEEACHEQERPRTARAVARSRQHAANRWLD